MNSISIRTGEVGFFDHLMIVSAAAGAVLFVVLCTASIVADGNWVLGTNMLSDLGVSANPTAALLFNASCILGGLCFMTFSLSKLMSEAYLDRVVGLVLVAACFMLFLVGVFTEDMPQHSRVAWGFCYTAIAAVAVAAVSDIAIRQWRVILACDVVVLIVLLSTFTMPFPFTEVVLVVAFGAWCAILSARHVALYSGSADAPGNRGLRSGPLPHPFSASVTPR